MKSQMKHLLTIPAPSWPKHFQRGEQMICCQNQCHQYHNVEQVSKFHPHPPALFCRTLNWWIRLNWWTGGICVVSCFRSRKLSLFIAVDVVEVVAICGLLHKVISFTALVDQIELADRWAICSFLFQIPQSTSFHLHFHCSGSSDYQWTIS